MPVKSIALLIPDTPPYDRPTSWFETFVGIDLLPLIENVPFKRFWFSRYGAVGHQKNILFRFEIDNMTLLGTRINDLQAKFKLGVDGYRDYDYAGDIGQGEKSRFLGVNSRHHDKTRRGEVAFDFLHGAAKLFLDCLTGPDHGGYFHLEPEQSSGFSVETSLEQFHHLFCNLSGVPTFICVATHPTLPGHQVMSFEEFKRVADRDKQWKLIHLGHVQF